MQAPCAEADRRYAVVLRAALPADAVDLAKQLLVLVGTLMTSVTSYYFATRAGAESDKSGHTNPAAPDPVAQRVTTPPDGSGGAGGASVADRRAGGVTPVDPGAAPPPSGTAVAGVAAATGAGATGPAAAAAHAHAPDDADGCGVEMLDATPDDQLPIATGGVASTREAT